VVITYPKGKNSYEPEHIYIDWEGNTQFLPVLLLGTCILYNWERPAFLE